MNNIILKYKKQSLKYIQEIIDIYEYKNSLF